MRVCGDVWVEMCMVRVCDVEMCGWRCMGGCVVGVWCGVEMVWEGVWCEGVCLE